MTTIYKFWKNSNTNELLKSQEFTDIYFNAPIFYYDLEGNKVGEDLELIGFVEIKEKKFKK